MNLRASQVALVVKNLPAKAGDVRDSMDVSLSEFQELVMESLTPHLFPMN